MNYKVYTTGEMIGAITIDKELLFEAITGIYDSKIVSFNGNMNWLMWNQNNSYEPISLNNDFMNAMWKVLSPSYVIKIDITPKCYIGEYIKNYCFIFVWLNTRDFSHGMKTINEGLRLLG